MTEKRSSRLDRAANLVFIVCAIGLSATYAVRHLGGAGPEVSGEPPEGPVAGWDRLRSAGTVIGAARAPVEIVEFGDFQCPACRAFHRVWDRVAASYGDSVALRYIHFPLPGNQWAVPAARAAECARSSGRFSDFHHALFDGPPIDGIAHIVRVASEVGIEDAEAFHTCATGSERIVAIDDGIRLGYEFRVKRTPTLIVNGWRMNGPPSYEQLARLIRAALDSVAATTRR
jgi:protein-disulfide isomerase